MGPTVRVFGDLEFSADPTGLSVSPQDYHGSPCHLAAEDLLFLGLCLTGGTEEERPPSVAQPWAASLSSRTDRAARGPALAKPGWALPQGHRAGGLLFARVRGGLDVFVADYHAGRVRLSAEDLAALGLAWKSGASEGRSGPPPTRS